EFTHAMNVTRIHEDPRVTKPYTEEQWADIDRVGRLVDQELKTEDVKLTMGGEPTFVSIDDMEGAQWTTAALGKEKWEISTQLLKRLKDRWTKGALIHTGLGKWYPGEPLPRWVLACYWRKDGQPVWKDESLLMVDAADSAVKEPDARKFMQVLVEQLGIDPENIVPGYEDVWYYLWKEKRLPVNVDPLASRLKDPLDRERLSKVFTAGLGDVIGYALPLACESADGEIQWYSRPWTFQDNHMYLVPGDSPMGLRLPLDSLPWSKQEDRQEIIERDPLEPLGPLQAQSGGNTQKAVQPAAKSAIRQGQSAKGVVRTALCIQVRDGKMCIFLPPVSKGEEYLDLINRIEDAAAALKTPVLIEGYPPPFDPRIQNFKITPDPGVIEVNVAPMNDWEGLVRQTTALYEDARLSRLGTEKFMLDGKHSGTGGGNHVVLGGETPADSPFLRRPDILASLVSYWHNHPALSYLFSGMFVGPTSQAPRVDEGRRDSLYELEIALQQVQIETEKTGHCPPWLVDRLFRHILVDGTGNTHRAEFCIDKLYSPDTATGRLGLVEFRSFEMPPHARMSLVQQLLIRAMVLKMWKEPYRPELVRWDTILHDRFLLPHFVREDFHDVLADLNDIGIGLKMEFFEPHFEFRFPTIGKVNYRGIELELKTAIEPWYVLGEEPAGGSNARFVDSSVERMQIKVKGVADKRYQITCNGYVIPLHSTGTQGEFVAGIRYRAWQPPNCLHPTIPVHTPLTFDIVDAWSKRSVGGCVYHVAHPGGRNYDTFPVNAYEAESRRMARFFKLGHTPGKMQTEPVEVVNPDYPLTLDLRRVS
ncbi:MAG: transglutaminase family protein, partial [Candidatus Omnitrophica bacterium]|nr:transglutaminase family protein [Candidatus Omnitrophota bacterium]